MVVEKHQLAGVDNRERGFNRVVELHSQGHGYQATLHYETAQVKTDLTDTTATALTTLIRTLHQMGYSQIRSQLSFRGEEYLGNQQPWVEHPDPIGAFSIASLWKLLRRTLDRVKR